MSMSINEIIILSAICLLFSSLAMGRVSSVLWIILAVFLTGIATGQSVTLTSVSHWYEFPTLMVIWFTYIYVHNIRSKTQNDGLRLKVFMASGSLSLEEMAEILHVSPRRLWFAKYELTHVPRIRSLTHPTDEETQFAAESFKRALTEVGVTFEELGTIFGDPNIRVQVERNAIEQCITLYSWFKKNGSTLIILEDANATF